MTKKRFRKMVMALMHKLGAGRKKDGKWGEVIYAASHATLWQASSYAEAWGNLKPVRDMYEM